MTTSSLIEEFALRGSRVVDGSVDELVAKSLVWRNHVMVYNTHGMELYNRGQYAMAEQQFLSAICLLRHSTGQTYLSSSMPIVKETASSNSKNNDNGITPSSTISIGVEEIGSNSIRPLRQAVPCCHHPSTASSSCTSVTMELGGGLDQGMNYFSNMVTSMDVVHDSILMMEATLLFNIAQSMRMQPHKMDTALQFHQQAICAVETMMMMNNNDTTHHRSITTILIPALHGAGEILYRQGQYSKATLYYQSALTHCMSTLGMDLLYVGITLNCLGVVAAAVALLRQQNSTTVVEPQPRAITLTTPPQPPSPKMTTTTNDTTGIRENDVVVNELLSTTSTTSTTPLQYFHQALDIVVMMPSSYGCNNHFNPNNSTLVATILNNIGRVLMQQGDLSCAVQYMEHALQIRRRDNANTTTMDVAIAAYTTGQCYHQLGDYNRAIVLYYEFLHCPAILRSTNHRRDVVFCMSVVAQIHEKRQEYDQAQTMHEECLSLGRIFLGKEHPDLALLLNRVGNYYFHRDMVNKALQVYKEGANIEHRTLHANHPNRVVTALNFGEIYKKKKLYNRAIRFYDQAMKIQCILFGECSTQVATIKNAIGLIYDKKGQWKFALQHLQQALVIQRTVLGDCHVDVATSLMHIGNIFRRKNKVHDALQIFTEALRIRVELLGPEHRSVSLTTYSLGLCHQLEGNCTEAIACFQQSLRIELQVLGEHHRDVALTLYKLGEVFKVNGEIDSALHCYQKSLAIEQRQSKVDHVAVATTLREIGNIHLLRSDVDSMMTSLVDAARTMNSIGRLFDYSTSNVAALPIAVTSLYAAIDGISVAPAA